MYLNFFGRWLFLSVGADFFLSILELMVRRLPTSLTRCYTSDMCVIELQDRLTFETFPIGLPIINEIILLTSVRL